MFQVSGDLHSDPANHSSHRVQIGRMFFVTALGALVSTSIFVLPVVALTMQTAPKSKIEQELDKKDTANKTPRTTNTGYSKPVSRRTPKAGQVPVTFFSDVTGAEISLDGKVIGIVKDDKRLTVNVKQGRYTARATFKGYNPQSMPVAIFGPSNYTILLGRPIPPPAPTPAPTPAAQPVAAREAATADEAPAPSFDDILRRFIDPVQTNQVTIAEWTEVTEKADNTTEQGAARVHLGRGQLAYLARNFAESVSEFNKAKAVLPNSGIAYYGLGNAYLATNQPVEAANAYKRAIDLTPEVAALANVGLGHAYTKLHKASEANSYYMKAREQGYLSPEINTRIAQNLMGGKQWEKALLELEAIEAKDSSAEGYLLMGECFENLKRPLNAYQAYLKATELDPKSAIAFAKLGDVLFSERDFVAAGEAYERALALDTTGASIDRQLIRKRANSAASQKKK